MTLVQWLMMLIGPLVSRALIYCGFAVLTIAGLQEAVDLLVSQVQASFGGIPSAVLQLASLANVPEGLGLVLGAYAARVLVWVKMNAVKMVIKHS